MSNVEDEPFEVKVNPSLFNIMQAEALCRFNKSIRDLSYEEAAKIIGGIFLFNAVQGGSWEKDGVTTVDSEKDGKEAYEGYTIQALMQFVGNPDERDILLGVTRRRNLWDDIRKRDPEVVRTYRFSL